MQRGLKYGHRHSKNPKAIMFWGECSTICEKNAHQFNMSCPKRKTTHASTWTFISTP